MSTEKYMKTVKMSTFIKDLIPELIVGSILFFITYFVLSLTLHVIFGGEFAVKDSLPDKFRSIELIGIILFVDFLGERKIYRFIKENPFASIDEKGLVLYFGRDSFMWEHVGEVAIEGERKLTIVFTEEGKQKKKVNDLKWLAEKDGFIRSLKRTCSEKKIPYRESEMTLSSRVGLILRMIKRSLFEPSPERK